MAWFDAARLDDEDALARADPALRHLAGAGARVRRDAGEAREAAAAGGPAGPVERPRALVVVGPGAGAVRDLVERTCPVPVVAWDGPGLPGWVGGLDVVVALDPRGGDAGEEDPDAAQERHLAVAVAVAEAVRRGTRVVLAGPQAGLAARHAVGRDSLVLPCESGEAAACVVVVLEHLHRLGLGPATDADAVAESLDDVARAASPLRDLEVNPAKALALVLAEATVLVWGPGPVEQDAARRVAGSLRRTAGRPALAGEADALRPMLEQARARDLFADPDDAAAPRPVLLVLDGEDPSDRLGAPGGAGPAHAARERLTRAAQARGLRVEVPEVAADRGRAARWAAHGLLGAYVATYLVTGSVED